MDGGRTSLRLPVNRTQKPEPPMDLARENQALHERLREEAARYDRRLDTYKLAQQRQAVLVSRLQAKVNFKLFSCIIFKLYFILFCRLCNIENDVPSWKEKCETVSQQLIMLEVIAIQLEIISQWI